MGGAERLSGPGKRLLGTGGRAGKKKEPPELRSGGLGNRAALEALEPGKRAAPLPEAAPARWEPEVPHAAGGLVPMSAGPGAGALGGPVQAKKRGRRQAEAPVEAVEAIPEAIPEALPQPMGLMDPAFDAVAPGGGAWSGPEAQSLQRTHPISGGDGPQSIPVPRRSGPIRLSEPLFGPASAQARVGRRQHAQQAAQRRRQLGYPTARSGPRPAIGPLSPETFRLLPLLDGDELEEERGSYGGNPRKRRR